MATDYILFLHGVDNRIDKSYSKKLFNKVKKILDKNKNYSNLVKSIELEWGSLNNQPVEELLNSFKLSKVWEKLAWKYREPSWVITGKNLVSLNKL